VEKKRDGMENKMDENRKEMEKKMDKNREHMEKKMLELKIFMSSMILDALDERLPKGDIKMKGNHENVEEIQDQHH
jgi:hypothetical protein